MPKYEHCPFRRISEHHGIFLERKNTRPCIKVGCLRPAVTYLSPFFSPPNRPVLDLTVPLGVHFLTEMKKKPSKGADPLTSVLHHLLQRWTPDQTEGWAWPRPGATTTAPGSFGFDDTEKTNKDETRDGKKLRNTELEVVISVGFYCVV